MLTLDTIDERRVSIAKRTPAKWKSELGQFMTPSAIARYMAGMFFATQGKNIRLLDAGAGIGSLTAAFVERAAVEKAISVECEAWELDRRLHSPLNSTLVACGELLRKAGVEYTHSIQEADFIEAAVDLFSVKKLTTYTHAILNPPYKKINSESAHRKSLREIGIETSNLYSAFVAIALHSLVKGGELVAITPRSFCNGSYFKPFRELMLHHAALTKIHIFESRTHAFKDDSVLQENVIFHLVKGQKQGNVLITSSIDDSFENVKKRIVPFGQIVSQTDGNKIFHLVVEEDSENMLKAMRLYTKTLEQLEIAVATGPVVDFRMRAHLREEVTPNCVPLIYPHHFKNGFVSHPRVGSKKPNFIEVNSETDKWMMPRGNYVVVRRLSSKEEKRRIVSAVFDASRFSAEKIGFDNHINVFHSGKKGLPINVAKGLAVYLGSTFADQWLRRFSGHTQINAGDLRVLRYPPIETLEIWGKSVGSELPTQEKIDEITGGWNG